MRSHRMKKNTLVEKLTYWSVDLQEAYASPREVKIKFDQINKIKK